MRHNKSSVKMKVHSTKCLHKMLEKSHTSELTEHLKTLEQKEINSPRRTRREKIIKLRAEIKKIETKKIIQRINETKSSYQQNRQTFIQTNHKVEREYPNEQNQKSKEGHSNRH